MIRLLSLLGFALFASRWLPVAVLPVNGLVAASDNQNNFYVATADNAVIKYDSLGNELYRFRGTGGTPAQVDVTNPMKPLLYYPASRTAVFTDNTLTLAGSLSFNTVGYTQVTAVCRSSDDHVWLFDGADFRVKKIDANGTLLRDGSDLLQQTGDAPDVHFMLEHDQKIYLCDSVRGIFVTDAYGNYETTLPLRELRAFQFHQQRLLYFKDGAMLLYDPRTAQTDTTVLDGVEPFRGAVYSQDRLLALGQNRLSLYARKSP